MKDTTAPAPAPRTLLPPVTPALRLARGVLDCATEGGMDYWILCARSTWNTSDGRWERGDGSRFGEEMPSRVEVTLTLEDSPFKGGARKLRVSDQMVLGALFRIAFGAPRVAIRDEYTALLRAAFTLGDLLVPGSSPALHKVVDTAVSDFLCAIDAGDADNIVQLALFGEVVFG